MLHVVEFISTVYVKYNIFAYCLLSTYAQKLHIITSIRHHQRYDVLQSIYTDNNVVETIVGSGQTIAADGLDTYAAFKSPYGLAFHNSRQYIFIADKSS